MTKGQKTLVGAAIIATLASGLASRFGVSPLLEFAVASITLALLATLVGEATDQLSAYLGPAATGVLQAAIGNTPEFFVSIFALRAGLVTLVQTSIVGSILVNSLLVLGIAFVAGGLKHGRQRFDSQQPRAIATLNLLAVAAFMIPTLTFELHTPAAGHESALSLACALLLLAIFMASVPFSLSQTKAELAPRSATHTGWSRGLSLGVLAGAGLGAALAADWFVDALTPAMATLGLSQAFAGLVVVAIASNAVENVVGIQLAWQNRADYAVSVVLNSSLQVALAVTPILVIASFVFAPAPLTLVMSPLLVVAVFLSALVGAVVVFDGESNWLEGLVLIGLYLILASAFWWG